MNLNGQDVKIYTKDLNEGDLSMLPTLGTDRKLLNKIYNSAEMKRNLHLFISIDPIENRWGEKKASSRLKTKLVIKIPVNRRFKAILTDVKYGFRN